MPAPKKKTEPLEPKADPVDAVARWIHDAAGESCDWTHWNTGKPFPKWDEIDDRSRPLYRGLAAHLLADPPPELVKKIMLG